MSPIVAPPVPADDGVMTSEPTPRRLYREPDERKVAGVCAGLGDYLGVDPSILRLAVILLGITTGWGFLAYLIAAIVIPSRPDDVARVQAPTRLGPENGSTVVVIALVLVISLALLRDGLWWEGPLPALVLLGFGLWILVGDGYRPLASGNVTPSGTTARAEATTVTAEAASPPDVPFGDTAVDTTEDRDQATRIPSSVPDHSAVRAGPQGEVPPPVSPWGIGPQEVDRTWGTIFAVICIAGGVVALLSVLDVIDLGFSTTVAGMLLAIGVAMIVGAWHGRRGRWLILLGIPAVALLVTDDLMAVPLDAGIGDRTLVVDLADLRTSDRELAIGELTIDLRQIDPDPGEVPKVSAEVGLGHLLVLLPDDMTARVDARSRVGDIEAEALPDRDGGVDVRERFTMEGQTDPEREVPRRRVELDLRVGVGEVEVRYA